MTHNLAKLIVLFTILLFHPSAKTVFCEESDDAPRSSIPKVVLIGDSIRLSYTPVVVERLAGRAEISSPAANGQDSANVLRNLTDWVVKENPDVVHFNCGIHDTKRFKETGRFQISPEQYEANLKEIVLRIRKETGAVVLFATTTPILDDRAARSRSDRDYELLNESVERYNRIARRVMADLDVPVNDLNAAIRNVEAPESVETLIGEDGVHLVPAGQKSAGETVADFLQEYLPDAESE